MEEKLERIGDDSRDPGRVFDLEEKSTVLVHSGKFAGGLVYDLYYSKSDAGKKLPLIVFATNHDDALVVKETGRGFRDLKRTISWARLFAEYGFYVLVYDSDGKDGRLAELLGQLKSDRKYARVGMDEIGIWSSGSDGAFGIDLIAGAVEIPARIRCVSFCYADVVWKDGISDEVGIQVVRAGKDRMMNPGIDAFIKAGSVLGDNVEVVNYEEGNHGFDYYLAINEASRRILEDVVDFYRSHLE